MRCVKAAIIVALSIWSPLHAQSPAQKKQFDALQSSVDVQSPEQRVAFNALMVSFSEYRDAHIASESCPSARHCSPAGSETEYLDADFLELAVQAPPERTQEDLTTADAQLNALYEKLITALPEICAAPNCLSQASLRNTQRTWIRYRDAWLTFGKLRWPRVSSEAMLTLLTRQRIERLQRISLQ